MTFKEVLAQVVGWLQQDRRVSYRALRRQFGLDEGDLDDLKEAILFSHPQVNDEAGQGLVWTGEPPPSLPHAHSESDKETRFQAVLPLIIELLQREHHVPYHTLKYGFGLDEALLSVVRGDLSFRELAQEEEGKGLVWIGKPQLTPRTSAISPSLSSSTESPEGSSTDSRPDDPMVERASARRAPEAERRQLTVMFCDLDTCSPTCHGLECQGVSPKTPSHVNFEQFSRGNLSPALPEL